MKTNLKITCLSLTLAFGLSQTAMAAPVICDSMQAINVKLEVVMEDAVLKDLETAGIDTLSLKPALSSNWNEEFPAENGAEITLSDTAGQIVDSMQEGLLVSYKVCEGNVVYAFCKMDHDLQGEFPKSVKLHLNPLLEKCKVEVLCTQCP